MVSQCGLVKGEGQLIIILQIIFQIQKITEKLWKIAADYFQNSQL